MYSILACFMLFHTQLVNLQPISVIVIFYRILKMSKINEILSN